MNFASASIPEPQLRPFHSSGGAIRLVFREPGRRSRQPAIFLDRDGVINERLVGGYVLRWDEFRFLEGSLRTLRALSRFGLPMLVISNQSGVAKGLMGRRALTEITTRMVRALWHAGARVDAAYYCPHVDQDACTCRKPKPGLLLQAARDWRIDLSRSVMVGDSLRDMEAASRAGCRGVLLAHEVAFAGASPGARPVNPADRVACGLPDVTGQVAALLERLSWSS